MHHAQHHEHQADLRREELDRLLKVVRLDPVLERERHISDVDEIEPDHQQLVDRIRQRLIAAERVQQEDPAVAEQR